MHLKVIRFLFCVLPLLAVVLCLIPERLFFQPGGQPSANARELLTFFQDFGTQWMVVLYASVYFAGFSFVQSRRTGKSFWDLRNPDLWLAAGLTIGVVSYASSYFSAARGTQALSLVGAVALGCGARIWTTGLAGRNHDKAAGTRFFLLILLAALSVASLPELGRLPAIGSPRLGYWTGMWGDPGTYGLLMAMGFVLAAGLWVSNLRSLAGTPYSRDDKPATGHEPQVSPAPGVQWASVRQKRYVLLSPFAAVIMGVGLIRSGSHAAWLAAFSGLAYLAWRFRSSQKLTLQEKNLQASSPRPWNLRRSLPGGIVIAVSGLIILWLSFRHSEETAVRVVVSTTDLWISSWMAACEGALQMMGEKPWFGFGWRESERFFDQFYLPPTLAENPASHLNAYFALGMTLGIPALLCVSTYAWILLRRTRSAAGESKSAESENLEPVEQEWPGVVSRAATIALLTGFSFNAGLFKIALAAPFWCLLTLGTASLQDATKKLPSRSLTEYPVFRWHCWPKWLRKVAAVSGTVAALILVIPPIQVLYVRWTNPSTTMPILIEQSKSTLFDLNLEPPQMSWKGSSETSVEFVIIVCMIEDARFFFHDGFDWVQIRVALEESQRTGRPSRGSSTITQQCARSLFLWQGRSWIRKGLEAYYTCWMEFLLSKDRILELYINVIELGRGIYGVEAASQHYYRIPARELSREQSAMLVNILPNPRERNPLVPTEFLKTRHAQILRRTDPQKDERN